MRGLVIKGIAGFYFVKTDEGIYRAKARGLFKKDKNLISVGDEVEIQIAENVEDDSWITEIMPRKNQFLRPPISNVDNIVVVFSVSNPEPNLQVIDKLLVVAEMKGVKPIICINKEDLDEGNLLSKYVDIYKNIYPVFVTEAISGEGLSDLKRAISGGKTALAGPSGVGKSTIINHLIPEANMETGEINIKTFRGKHTTRHVEIFQFEGGYLFDTPGFTSLDIDHDDELILQECFPEFSKLEKCKFVDCMHINEPDCQVIKAYNEGKISESRYNSYISMVKEVKERKKHYE